MKKGNVFKIILVALCLCAVLLFSLTAAGVNVPFLQEYKMNFKHNIIGIADLFGIELPIEMQLYLDDETVPTPKPTMMPASEEAAMEEALGYPEEEPVETKEGTADLTTKAPVKVHKKENLPLAVDSASNAKYADLGGNVVSVNETRYRGYNSKGELIWELPIQMQSPQITVRGEYVLINETGAKKISLYKGKKKLYEESAEGNIITADLSKKGDVVAVTEKEFYKGQVMVLNSSGKKIFAWDSGSYNILDAAISNGRRVAISLLNTDVGADSVVVCFDVNGKEKYRTANFSNSIIFEVEFDGERLNAIADDRCIGISKTGKTAWEHSYGDRVLKNYAIAQNGSKLLLLENNGVGELQVISAGGKMYEAIKPESMPDTVSIKADYIAYNSGRDIVVCNFKGKKLLRASCSADIKQAYAIQNKKVFCVYNSSIQVVKVEKAKKQETIIVSGDDAGKE